MSSVAEDIKDIAENTPVKSPATPPLHFVVSGYYGCGNAGDEAVLAGIARSFARQSGGRVRLTVLSQNPDATTRLHGLAAVDRMNMAQVKATLRESDLLLSGGGSLLQDTTSVRSLLYYLWIARMARQGGKPVMFYAQGMGPLNRPISRLLVRHAANRAAYLTVRDEPSAQLLKAIGVTNPRLEVTADPAFALTPAPAGAVDAILRQEGVLADMPLIAVALRPWSGSGLPPLDTYARLLTELERQTGARIVLLPMHAGEDVAFALDIVQRMGKAEAFSVIRGAYAPDVLLGIVGRMQAVVAMRLHALIFAARQSVPPFALAYDPKVENLMNLLGLADSLVSWNGFDPDIVAAQVAALVSDRAARSADLHTYASILEQRALHTADIALDLFAR